MILNDLLILKQNDDTASCKFSEFGKSKDIDIM